MYKGSRLQALCKKQRGLSTELSLKLFGKRKGIDRYYKDGLNLTIDILEKIAEATGFSVEYFLDYNRPTVTTLPSSITGDHNIINSPMANEAMSRIDHLNDVIKLKDEIIEQNKKLIESKDDMIKSLKAQINDDIELMKSLSSDSTRTR